MSAAESGLCAPTGLHAWVATCIVLTFRSLNYSRSAIAIRSLASGCRHDT